MSAPMERLTALDSVEKDILSCLQSAGQALVELSKEKPSQKQVDAHTSHFLKTLNHVELETFKHINYLTQVSTGQAHEGSSYASQKILQMAWHRSEHARSKVVELERMKTQMMVMSAGAAVARQNAQAIRPGGTSSLPPTPTSTVPPTGFPATPQSVPPPSSHLGTN